MDIHLKLPVDALVELPPAARLDAIVADAPALLSLARAGALADSSKLVDSLVALVESGAGAAHDRLIVGALLGWIGDPRIGTPSDADYWVELTLRSGDVFQIGRHAVTNQEYQAWVAAGGYEDRAAWSEEGWGWLQGCGNPWPVLAQSADAERYLVPNQPVIGVCWHEAQAYAKAHGARLPRWYERVWAVRGAEKRPYPWGSPFGEGNANTKEEVLQRPVAVGLYRRDRTPEGVADLAGNVSEWTAEQIGDEVMLHPGSWDQPSLASWAKASTTESPEARWLGIGFRLARDI